MARKPKVQPFLQLNEEGKPLSGVGPRAAYTFVKHYFPEAQQTIRIASAYFTLTGYKQGRPYIAPNVQIQVLVGREEGVNVKATVIEEIVADLGQCETNLWETVFELVERMKNGQFIIRDAREMETPFHCKFYISDDKLVWHGSANYTGSGLSKNAEQVSLSRDTEQIDYFTRWYDSVAKGARDLMAELIKQLEEWLNLATPFEIYLKTLLLLNNLPDYKVRLEAHTPAYYQKGVIAHALRQANEFGGSLIVAATGLGKTVIGAEIAARLDATNEIKRIILIMPNGVRENWEREFQGRDIRPEYFNIDIPFRKASRRLHHKVSKLEYHLRQADKETIIIIDEAHFYRNQLLVEKSNRRRSLVYHRLLPAVRAGAKIFLLTATAYGTNLQNLNSLLYLLPHCSETWVDKQNPWKAVSPDNFAHLPVVIVLGLPHVLKMARSRGDVDTNGRTFIQFPDKRRYLPKSLKLHSVQYELCVQSELQEAFNRQCFDQISKIPQLYFDDESPTVQQGLVDSAYNGALLSWLSSPTSMALGIERNLATLDESNEVGSQSDAVSQLSFLDQPARLTEQNPRSVVRRLGGHHRNARMRLSHDKREAMLAPLLSKLLIRDSTSDNKFLKLKTIIEDRCIKAGSKAIIFVRRYATALYVAEMLGKAFGSQMNIGCTVEVGKVRAQLKAGPHRSDVLKHFSPRSHNYTADQEYDVLICTDADSVGINLQDADTVINYDPPIGADILFQRAGRILRMTPDPERIVYFYTLVPSIIHEKDSQSRVHMHIREIFKRVEQRHDKSKRILGSGVMSNEAHVEITLDSNEVEQIIQDNGFLGDIGGKDVESILSHTAILEQFRTQAEQLPPYLLSARSYRKSQHRVFVMLKYEHNYYPLIFNVNSKKLESFDNLAILDMISCTESEPRAMVRSAYIDHLANVVVRKWCKQENVLLDQVNRICALYLAPSGEKEGIAHLFKDFEDEGEE